MTFVLRTAGLIAALLLLVLGLPATLGLVGAPPAPPEAGPLDAYDSIRTDLSDYRWPLAESRSMTSSFGEYRRTHFHAGIDISTGDFLGFKVLASRDGSVARVSVSPSGYGKILYLRHDDGYTTTYAHLRGFIAPIESLVRAEQLRRGVYPVDLRLPPGKIRVSGGGLVAYSGDTGSGSAHLHFEIRDEHNNAVNPLLCDPFSVEDTLPPIIRAVAFLPAGPLGLVDGGWDPVVLQARQVSRQAYRLDRTVTFAGEASIAVYARDRSNRSNFLHGVYSLRLAVDDSVVLAVEYTRVPIMEGNQIRLVYVQDPGVARRGRFHKLYVDGAHRLPIFGSHQVGDGVLRADGLAPGRRTFTIDVTDYNGNTSRLTGAFTVNPAAELGGALLPAPPSDSGSGPRMSVDFPGEFIRVVVDGAAPSDTPPLVSMQEGDGVRDVAMRPVGAGLFAGSIVPLPAQQVKRTVIARVAAGKAVHMLSKEVTVLPLLPGISGDVVVDHDQFRVLHGPAAAYRRTNLRFSPLDEPGVFGYQAEPQGIPLDDGITLGVRQPRGMRHAGLYMRSGSEWSFLSADTGTGQGWLWGRMRQFLGDVAVLSDSIPPEISGIRIRPEGSSKPSISFRFRDSRSGVEYKSLKVYIDSVMVIPEIDGEHRRAHVQPDAPLSRGPHRLTIRCADRMGNSVVVERTFRVR